MCAYGQRSAGVRVWRAGILTVIAHRNHFILKVLISRVDENDMPDSLNASKMGTSGTVERGELGG